jgi:hypothetical protein
MLHWLFSGTVSNKVCPLSRFILIGKTNRNTGAQGRLNGISMSTVILSTVAVLFTFLSVPITAGDFSEQVPPNISRVEPRTSIAPTRR